MIVYIRSLREDLFELKKLLLENNTKKVIEKISAISDMLYFIDDLLNIEGNSEIKIFTINLIQKYILVEIILNEFMP